jgi:hypothetical protein
MTGVLFPAGIRKGFFLFAAAFSPAFPGLEWPGSQTDHSPPRSAEVKNTCNYISTPPYVFMALYVIK